ncbi:MAG: hypothetical protein QOC98_2120 [Frankiaceae bacterium]|nr:hypothetical protein [Frankiaceae bacterium]
MFRRTTYLLPLALTAGLAVPTILGSPSSALAAAANPSVTGQFAAPFQEPGRACTIESGPKCVPAGVSVVVLPNGKIVYWDGLEGMDDAQIVLTDFARTARNSQSRLMDLRGPTWSTPTPYDGGANPSGNNNQYLPGVPHDNTNKRNDGDLFCSDQVLLSDGRVLAAGGTAYYFEPGFANTGATELEGLKNSRIYNPSTNRWTQSGSMHYGRWYPSMVTLANGRVLVTSGVTKLFKPIYPNRPTDSGANVRQTETYNPATGQFSTNPPSANKSLPLYPRLHLLPDGKVYYDAGGQTFNPQGEAVDEATWNTTSVYDPAKQNWTDIGVPQVGPLPGFRGSAFSQMLQLKPPYNKAQFLSAGGVYGTTPGTYLPTDSSTLNTVTIRGKRDVFKTEQTGNLNQPRWYGTGVTLPTGEVLLFSGATRDETNLPGSGNPIRQVEIYNPITRTWSNVATASHGRTYHNSATLLPDGRVLLGGHAPLGTLYISNRIGDVTKKFGFSKPEPDPTFELYSPPNLFYGSRPVITSAPATVQYGRTMRIGVTDPRKISSVVLVRNTAITHLVDGDQRSVALKVVSRDAQSVTVQTPPRDAVAPNGPYMLFVNKRTPKGQTPSVSRQVFVGSHVGAAQAAALQQQGAAQTRAELAAPATATSAADTEPIMLGPSSSFAASSSFATSSAWHRLLVGGVAGGGMALTLAATDSLVTRGRRRQRLGTA